MTYTKKILYLKYSKSKQNNQNNNTMKKTILFILLVFLKTVVSAQDNSFYQKAILDPMIENGFWTDNETTEAEVTAAKKEKKVIGYRGSYYLIILYPDGRSITVDYITENYFIEIADINHLDITYTVNSSGQILDAVYQKKRIDKYNIPFNEMISLKDKELNAAQSALADAFPQLFNKYKIYKKV